MRIVSSLLLPLMFISTVRGQQIEKFNLSFDHKLHNKELPEGWFKWGNYKLTTDSAGHIGKNAGKVSATEAGDSFGCIAYHIPANYTGKTIKLQGLIKTDNVSEGHAGLLLRVDKKNKTLAFDNMNQRPVKGTTGWTKYETTLPYPEDGDAIYIGGILSGKGTAWFDDFVISIDGKDIQTLKEVEKIIPKAELDKAFDNGSGISLTNLSTNQMNNLSLLGRVWGFLKYHHPEIAKGNYNWDYELFRFLPNYLKTDEPSERDDLLISWIQSLGTISDCNDCPKPPSNPYLKADISWIDKQDTKLKNALTHIYTNRNTSDHYYIDLVEGIGNPNFKNEEAYSKMNYPDTGFRLLALYRYWNIINYFFPYKYIADKEWNSILPEYVPHFINASDELAYEQAMLKLIAEVHDSHANLGGAANKIQQWKGLHLPTLSTRFIEGQLTVTDFFNDDFKIENGLALGDVIHKIDGTAVEQLVEDLSPYYPASNRTMQYKAMANDLLRSDKPTVTIEYSSSDKIKQKKTLQLHPATAFKEFAASKKTPPVSYKMLDDNIGYITLQTIKQEDISEIKKNFKNAKGIIIDIRNYPSTFVPFSLGSFFVSGSSPFVRFTTGDISNPGFFTLSDNLSISNKGEHYAGPVVVLVNEQSVSQSEYTAMAFRAGVNTTIVGSTTAGADGNVSYLALPGGLQTAISGIGIYYPDGTATQRIGIVPDIEVQLSIKGIREGKDEPLEKAIELIKKI